MENIVLDPAGGIHRKNDGVSPASGSCAVSKNGVGDLRINRVTHANAGGVGGLNVDVVNPTGIGRAEANGVNLAPDPLVDVDILKTGSLDRMTLLRRPAHHLRR